VAVAALAPLSSRASPGSSPATDGKWNARGNTILGNHATEEGAARAYIKYCKDGVVPEPADRGPAGSSQFKGVSWDKNKNKWRADCTGTKLGYHATEEDAARAYKINLKDGIDPVKHRDAGTSQFAGVSWAKIKNKWEAKCKERYLGHHTTQEAAARAYNVEAERVGRPLNVIPPVGAAGSGAGGGATPKRAAPMTPAAPATSKNTMRAAPALATPAKNKKIKL